MTLLTPRAARRDSSVPLLRTLIPKVVVQDRQCSVHAAAVSPRGCPRLCVVKVKLTMSLALSREPVELRRQAAPDLFRFPAGSSHRRRQTEWSSCGEGWGQSPDLARNDRHYQGGPSQGPPFAFSDERRRMGGGRTRETAICALAPWGQSRLSGTVTA